MTVRISPGILLCMAMSAGGCNPKQAPTQVAPEAGRDTPPPPVPTSFTPPRDSTRTVAVPSDPEVRYHRHLVGVMFDDSTSGITIHAVLLKYQATIVGGFPGRGTRGAYMLQVPDTVTTYRGLQDLINQIGSEVGVDYAFGTTWRGKLVPRDRHPVDGMASDTTRPVMPTTTNWPLESPLLVTVPYNPSLKNFRDVFGIEFDTSTSGTMIRAFLVRFNAVIIGGYGQGTSAPTYVVRVPDPGTTFQAVDSLVAVMGAYNGVRQARAMNYEGSLRLKKSD